MTFMSERNPKRILLKISGEALGKNHFIHNSAIIDQISSDIKTICSASYQVCLVVGGGNICRGSNVSIGVDRATADYMGMLSTVINALALQGNLEGKGVFTRVMSSLQITPVAEPYIRRKAIRHLEKNRVIIFAAGTGNPYFSTDTAAVLRAIEMNCSCVLKGSMVDGVYDDDPKKHKDTKKYSVLTHQDVINKELKVMDSTAIALAYDNDMPIKVFDIHEKGAFFDVVQNNGNFTLIKS